jgi:glycosyltransferase involved in cell wall biosynthesis
MKKPRISVIITTHNRADKLGHAIKSVLAQDFDNFEVIVVDDGSTDSTQELLREYREHIRSVRSEKNLGGMESLNIGLKEAEGQYIAVLDDDDVWIHAQKLNMQYEYMESHPDCMAVGTNGIADIVDKQGRALKTVVTNVPLTDEAIKHNFLLTNNIAHVTSFYRRDAALSVGGYSFPRGKDWDLFLKLGMIGRLANIPAVTARWQEKRILKIKLRDARYRIPIVWKHRKNYPYAFRSLGIQLIRLIALTFLAAIRPSD